MGHQRRICMMRQRLPGSTRFDTRSRCAIACVRLHAGLVSAMILAAIFAGVGCGTMTVVVVQPLEDVPAAETTVGMVPQTTLRPLEENLTDARNPLEPFNNTMLTFNYGYFDRYLMTPVTDAYGAVVGEGEQQLIHNLLDNLSTPKRLINSLLQGKFKGAGREISRFIINSTLGGIGMTDVAKYQFGIEKSDADFGQTLEVWGWSRSRSLIVPFMPPLTVRDGVGFVVDQALNPVAYFFPLPVVGALAKDTVTYINNGGLHPKTFQNVDAPVRDFDAPPQLVSRPDQGADQSQGERVLLPLKMVKEGIP